MILCVKNVFHVPKNGSIGAFCNTKNLFVVLTLKGLLKAFFYNNFAFFGRYQVLDTLSILSNVEAYHTRLVSSETVEAQSEMLELSWTLTFTVNTLGLVRKVNIYTDTTCILPSILP